MKNYCTTHDVDVSGGSGGIGVNRMLKFYIKVLYVMGKELSGVLSWSQDYKTFFMLNSTEHENFPAHKC